MTRAIFSLPHPVHGTVQLIPLLAVGEATDGVLTPEVVADMVADPESYCDVEQSAVVSAYEVRPDLTLKPLLRAGMARLANSANPKVAAKIVVDAAALESVFQHMQTQLPLNHKLQLSDQQLLAAWDPHAQLPATHAKVIREALPKSVFASDKGTVSKQEVLDRLLAAMEVVKDKASRAGRAIDTSQLPGTRRVFVRLLSTLDPRIARAEPTLFDYFDALKWKWVQGAPRDGADWLLDLFSDRVRKE